MGGFGAWAPLEVGICCIPTRGQYVPVTVLFWIDANFKDAIQFLDKGGGSVTSQS